jgi:hypothetical protein
LKAALLIGDRDAIERGLVDPASTIATVDKQPHAPALQRGGFGFLNFSGLKTAFQEMEGSSSIRDAMSDNR